MKNNRKKILIPCYRDMDAYDLPEGFAHLQALDMSKLGFIQDLIRGVKKIVGSDEVSKPAQTPVAEAALTNIQSLLKRVLLFLEDGDWKSANEYCEKVLDTDPENAEAYLGKVMAEGKCHSKDELYNKIATDEWAVKHGWSRSPERLTACREESERISTAERKYAIADNGEVITDAEYNKVVSGNKIVNEAVNVMRSIRKDMEYTCTFDSYVSSLELKLKCLETFLDKDLLYTKAVRYANGKSAAFYSELRNNACEAIRQEIDDAKAADKKTADSIHAAYIAHLTNVESKWSEKAITTLATLESKYLKACEKQAKAKTEEDFRNIQMMFWEIRGYKDSEKRIEQCREIADEINAEDQENIYNEACMLQKNARTSMNYEDVIKLFQSIASYKDSSERLNACLQKFNVLANKEKSKKEFI